MVKQKVSGGRYRFFHRGDEDIQRQIFGKIPAITSASASEAHIDEAAIAWAELQAQVKDAIRKAKLGEQVEAQREELASIEVDAEYSFRRYGMQLLASEKWSKYTKHRRAGMQRVMERIVEAFGRDLDVREINYKTRRIYRDRIQDIYSRKKNKAGRISRPSGQAIDADMSYWNDVLTEAVREEVIDRVPENLERTPAGKRNFGVDETMAVAICTEFHSQKQWYTEHGATICECWVWLS